MKLLTRSTGIHCCCIRVGALKFSPASCKAESAPMLVAIADVF